MFERPKNGERAVLVHLDLQQEKDREALEEIRDLAISAGVEPVAVVTGARRVPEPKYFVGSGKAEEIRAAVQAHAAEVVLVNHALSPAQERNLEQLIQCRVLDRTTLILDIFAQRARSHEGKLQVELAQLRHLSTRLVRGWTHLERQRGGIGLRGPGETQLETDRRLLGERIRQLNKRLDKVDRRREQSRRARNRAEIPVVSLVGYTNAGKSTVFNRLTDAAVLAANQLFATLDPTMRRVPLPNGQAMVLADTVGFIRHLPHDLVAAFRSTLQETRDADLLLHVIDAHDGERQEKTAEVNEVLREIGAEGIPQIEVFNKIDLVDGAKPGIERDENGRVRRVHVSALTGAGFDLLLAAAGEFLRPAMVRQALQLPPSAGRLRAQLYALGAVRTEHVEENGDWCLEVELKPHAWSQLRKTPDYAAFLPAP